MKSINLELEAQKRNFSDKLIKSLDSSNINILLGSGFSKPILSVLGSIEERLTEAKKMMTNQKYSKSKKNFLIRVLCR